MICRFGTWNVSSLYRSGSLTTVGRELARCKLDLVGVQEVRWEKKYQMKSLLGNCNGKVGRENIFSPTIGNESLHQDSNANVVRIVNFATKNIVFKSTILPHRNIPKYRVRQK
jgi:hypothetical protein